MNLLQIDTEVKWGGGQQQVAHLCHGLAEKGHRVTLACHRDGALRGRMEGNGVRLLPLPAIHECDPRGVLGLIRVIREERFDLMHMHSSRAHTMGVAAGMLARFRPRVVSRRSNHSARKDPINRWKYGRGIDRVVAISASVKRSLVQSGFDPGEVDLVHSGILPPRRVEGAFDDVRQEFGLPADARLAVCVANLVPVKGHDTLIGAMTRLTERWPALRLLLAGEGPQRQRLEQRCREAGLDDRIIFAGFRTDTARLLSAANLAVCPSRTEGLGLAILDALALELPVAASRAGGIPEIISHEETGLLVPPEDPDALADALDRLLTNPELAGRLGRNGRRMVLERFSVQAMVEGTEAVYHRLLGKGPQSTLESS